MHEPKSDVSEYKSPRGRFSWRKIYFDNPVYPLTELLRHTFTYSCDMV